MSGHYYFCHSNYILMHNFPQNDPLPLFDAAAWINEGCNFICWIQRLHLLKAGALLDGCGSIGGLVCWGRRIYWTNMVVSVYDLLEVVGCGGGGFGKL